jgi:hypothetical protein
MRAVSIGEIQKNISILTNLTEPLNVIDGRKKEHIAIITPVRQNISVKELGAKYKNRIPAELRGVDTKIAFESAMSEYVDKKYENSAH